MLGAGGWAEPAARAQHCDQFDFSGCDLRGADLRQANLSGVRPAWPGHASRATTRPHRSKYSLPVSKQFTPTLQASFEGADLSGADLEDADLSDTQLRGANLRGARLVGVTVRLQAPRSASGPWRKKDHRRARSRAQSRRWSR